MGMRTTAARRAGGLAIALLLLSACGSNGNGSSTNGSSGTTVSTKPAGSGTVLVDSSGRTLYFTDQDTASEIACVGGCAQVWLPLTVSAATTPTAPGGVPGTLGTMARPGGSSMQVTYDGKPLYTFTLDSQPGALTGNGVTDQFGSTRFTWHAAFTAGGVGSSSTPQLPGY
jgi:predicted lipoprotein with Yx(FWY)xxD motif